MIGPGTDARVIVATRPVDFRKGPDSSAALVAEDYGGKPFSGVVYVFRAKRTDRIKLIWWDTTGLCLMAKRLEQGSFSWPSIQDGVMRLTAAQLGALLEGLARLHIPAVVVSSGGLLLDPSAVLQELLNTERQFLEAALEGCARALGKTGPHPITIIRDGDAA